MTRGRERAGGDRRASEYERIYHRADPVRQSELRDLETAMKTSLKGRVVLEVACGTGYWTQRLAERAQRVVAIDASLETLEIARSKAYLRANVEFLVGGAFALEMTGCFDGGMTNFWLAHAPKARLGEFLATPTSSRERTFLCGQRLRRAGVRPKNRESRPGGQFRRA